MEGTTSGSGRTTAIVIVERMKITPLSCGTYLGLPSVLSTLLRSRFS